MATSPDSEASRTVLLGAGHSRHEAKRSVFIGVAEAAASEDLWRQRVDALRAEQGAHHVAWALRLANGVERAVDDGEPAATAGQPCLQALQSLGIVQAGVAVARHFGGTLLGRGGLIRAYGRAAREAVADAGLVVRRPHARLRATIAYPDWPAVEAWLREVGGTDLVVEATTFGTDVRAHLLVPLEEASGEHARPGGGGAAATTAHLRDLTAGRCQVEQDAEPVLYP